MIILQAPFDVIQTTILLPSPQFGDYTSPQIKVTIRNAEDGTIYSTVKTSDRDKLEWDFQLTHAKARELACFIEAYNGHMWRVTTVDEYVYYAYLLTNPVEFSPVSLSTTNVRLEFEGTRIV